MSAMSATEVQLRFAAEFALFLVSIADIGFAVLRSELLVERTGARVAAVLGFAGLAAAAFASGALVVDDPTAGTVVGLRLAGVVMLLVAVLYFTVLGGIIGTTIGEYVIAGGKSAQPARLNLQGVAARTRDAILRDSHFVEQLGLWVGRSMGINWHWPLDSFHKVGRGL